MEVDPADTPRNLIEADVVEALKTRAVDCANAVIRHQKVFFPSHKQVLLIGPILGDEIGPRAVFGDGFVRRESAPVLPVHFLVGPPFRMLRDERVFTADDFAFKVSGETGVVLSQSFDAQIAAQKRLLHVNKFDFHLNVVFLAIGCLITFESAPGP